MSAVDKVIYRYVVEKFGADSGCDEEIAREPVQADLEELLRHVAGLVEAIQNPTDPRSAETLKAARDFAPANTDGIDSILYNARDIGRALEFLPGGVAAVTEHFREERRRSRGERAAQVAEYNTCHEKLIAEALADPVAWLWGKLVPSPESPVDGAALAALTDAHLDELARRYRASLVSLRARVTPKQLPARRPKAGQRTARTMAKRPARKAAGHA